MGIIKRTFISLTKRLSRTIILLIVIFLLGNVIAGSVAVKNATGQLENSMKGQLGAKVKIDYDMSKMMSNNTDSKMLTSTLSEEIGKLPEVKSTNYDLTATLGSDVIKKYISENSSLPDTGASFYDFQLAGSNSGNPLSFQTGKNQLVEGVLPKNTKDDSDVHEVAISKELAEKNKLKIGDTTTFYSSLLEDTGNDVNMVIGGGKDPEIKEKREHKVKIVGIFKNKGVDSTNPMEAMMAEMDANTIYSSLQLAKEIDDYQAKYYAKSNNVKEEDARMPVTPTYELKSPEQIDSFKEKATKIMDSDLYKITTSKDSFESVAGSLISMNKLSKGVLIFGVIATVLILSLVLILFLKERRKEFGIYQALGESKIRTVLQLVLEVLIVAVISVSLAVYSGNFIAKGISTQMIETQITQSEKNSSNSNNTFIISDSEPLDTIDKDEIIKNYEVKITKDYLVFFYGIMLMTVILSTVLPTSYILRLKPRKILL